FGVPPVAWLLSVKSSASISVPAGFTASGYVLLGTFEHARCHCGSLHSVAPIVAHAAAACGYVMFVHGITSSREHTMLSVTPVSVAVASGLDASYFIICLPPPMSTQSWPSA